MNKENLLFGILPVVILVSLIIFTLGFLASIEREANRIVLELKEKFPSNSIYVFKGDDTKYSIQRYSSDGYVVLINVRTGEDIILRNLDAIERAPQ